MIAEKDNFDFCYLFIFNSLFFRLFACSLSLIISMSGLLHRVSKNVPHSTCYKSWRTRSDYHNFWQKCLWESGKSDDALFSHLTYLVLLHYLAKQETQKTAHCSALCMQHSPTAAALSTSFLLNYAPNTPYSWTHWLQDLKLHSITLAGSKLVGDQLRTSFEPDSAMEFGREPASSC